MPHDFSNRPYYDPDAEPAVLETYINRLVQYVGPTPAQAADPEHRSSRIQSRKTGVRDEELAAIDPTTMTSAARASFHAHLVRTGRLELAVTKFPNLAALAGD